MQEETGGISIGDIFRTIATQKWLALILAVVITVAGTLIIQLGFNYSAKRYVTEFKLELPNDYLGETYTYFDGSKFHYTDFASRESLAEVKNSDKKFASVDIDAMTKNNDVSVARSVVEITEEKSEVTFAISVSSKYFADSSTARDFLSGLANIPVTNLSKTIIDCDVFLAFSREADSYETEISLLQSQLSYLTDGYRTLMNKYGENFVAGGRTLYAYFNELTTYNKINTLNVLGTKVKEEGILKSEDEKSKYEMERMELNRNLGIAEATLKVLLSAQETGGSTTIVDASIIKTQSDLVENLKVKIKDMTRYIDEGIVDADLSFKSNYIDPEYNALSAFTETYEQILGEVYNKVSSVTFTRVGVISQTGGTGLLTSILLSMVIGVLVALVVAYILGNIKLKKTNCDKVSEHRESANDENV